MQNEIDPVALESLLKNIVDKYCSEADRNNFSMTGELQIELALEGKYSRDASRVSDSDAFGVAEAKMIVEVAALIVGSVKTFLEIKKLRNASSITKDNSQDISARWGQKLIEEGISPDKAKAIVTEFKDELGTVLK